MQLLKIGCIELKVCFEAVERVSTKGTRPMFIFASYKFLEHLRAVQHASIHTVRNYCIDLNAFKLFLEKELLTAAPVDLLPDKIWYNRPYSQRSDGRDSFLPIEKVDRLLLRRFLAYMHEREKSRRTLVRRLASLRSFFKFAHQEKYLSSNPMEELEGPRLEKTIPLTLSYQQVVHLLDQPTTSDYLGFRDRTIMELFYSSGLRVSELCGLDRSHFDAEQLLLTIMGKGNKPRIVPITRNAADWICRYLSHPERHLTINHHWAERDQEAVFLNRWGTRLTSRSVDRNFDRYLRQSGLSGKATPHTIRHTIATHWLENGMDLKTIGELLGHSCLSTTTIYTQVSTKLKKQAYDATKLFD